MTWMFSRSPGWGSGGSSTTSMTTMGESSAPQVRNEGSFAPAARAAGASHRPRRGARRARRRAIEAGPRTIEGHRLERAGARAQGRARKAESTERDARDFAKCLCRIAGIFKQQPRQKRLQNGTEVARSYSDERRDSKRRTDAIPASRAVNRALYLDVFSHFGTPRGWCTCWLRASVLSLKSAAPPTPVTTPPSASASLLRDPSAAATGGVGDSIRGAAPLLRIAASESSAAGPPPAPALNPTCTLALGTSPTCEHHSN